MSQAELDRLLDQLLSEDAKDRRNAAKRLGELGQPEAIAELVNLYQKDPDPGVRKAAQEALVAFRRLEQKMLGLDDEDEEGKPKGLSIDLNPILEKGRLVLAVALAITILINAGFFIVKLIPPPAPPNLANATLTPRSDLVGTFKKRIADVHAEASTLRGLFAGIQGLGMAGVNQDSCQSLAASSIQKVDLSPIDNVTYPDLPGVNDLINIPTLKIIPLRNNYIFLCSIKDQRQFEDAINKQGGAAELVKKADEVNNKDLPAADAALKKAIDNPAPTVGPTFTPKPTSTSTPLPTATFTITQTPGPTSAATEAPAGTSAPASTNVVSGPTQPVPQSYTFTDLGLSNFKSYRYRITGKSSGTLNNNKTFNGSLQVSVKRQPTPLSEEIDVSLNEGNPSLRFFQSTVGPLYSSGVSTYIIADGILYETGDVLTNAKYNGRCRATRFNDQVATKVSDYKPDISGVPLTLKESNVATGSQVTNHYHGEKELGNSKEILETVDVFINPTNQVPVQITIATMLNPNVSASARAASGLKSLNVTITYEMVDQDVAVSAIKPIACEGVPVQ